MVKFKVVVETVEESEHEVARFDTLPEAQAFVDGKSASDFTEYDDDWRIAIVPVEA